MSEQQSSFPATWTLVEPAEPSDTWQVRGESGVPLGALAGAAGRRTASVTVSVTAEVLKLGSDHGPLEADEVVAREILRALLRRSIELYG